MTPQTILLRDRILQYAKEKKRMARKRVEIDEERVLAMRAEGASIKQIAGAMFVSNGVIQRLLANRPADGAVAAAKPKQTMMAVAPAAKETAVCPATASGLDSVRRVLLQVQNLERELQDVADFRVSLTLDLRIRCELEVS